MAKAKAKVATKSKLNGKGKKAVNKLPTLPTGYRVIGRAPNWDIEKHPLIEGERGPIKEVKFAGQKKGEKARVVRTMIVNDETIGAVNVWESGMLTDFFDQTEEGQVVRVEFLGYGAAKKGQNAPKLFSTMVKD